MPVVYPRKIREALASIDIDILKKEMLKQGFEFTREGGFRTGDEPFRYANYVFYKHPDSGMEIRIGHHKEPWLNNDIFEICYCPADGHEWRDVTPDFRRAKWRKVSSRY